MTDPFEDALKIVLEHEGGYVNHPNDPGGATNRGITQRTYDAYRQKKGLSPQDVRYITEDEVREIYRKDYWEASGADKLPPPLNLVHFDTAVNMGPGRAREFLSKVDQSDPCKAAQDYLSLREARYHAIVQKNQKQRVFLSGWLNRVNNLRKHVQAHPQCKPSPRAASVDALKGTNFSPSSVGRCAPPCTQLGTAGSTSPVLKPNTEFCAVKSECRYNDGIVIEGDEGFIRKVIERLDKLAATKTGKAILNELDKHGKQGRVTTIRYAEPGNNQCFETDPKNARPRKAGYSDLNDKSKRVIIAERGIGSGSVVGFNPDYEPKYPYGSSCRPPEIGLAHELIHALHNARGENLRNFKDPSDEEAGGSNHEEARTIGRGAYTDERLSDNSLREEMGYRRRKSHASVCPEPDIIDLYFLSVV